MPEIVSRPASKEYRDNWDRVFGGRKECPNPHCWARRGYVGHSGFGPARILHVSKRQAKSMRLGVTMDGGIITGIDRTCGAVAVQDAR